MGPQEQTLLLPLYCHVERAGFGSVCSFICSVVQQSDCHDQQLLHKKLFSIHCTAEEDHFCNVCSFLDNCFFRLLNKISLLEIRQSRLHISDTKFMINMISTTTLLCVNVQPQKGMKVIRVIGWNWRVDSFQVLDIVRLLGQDTTQRSFIQCFPSPSPPALADFPTVFFQLKI